jgi:maltose 6'-phosphate phosphatase
MTKCNDNKPSRRGFLAITSIGAASLAMGGFSSAAHAAGGKPLEGAGFKPTWNDLKIDVSKEFTYNAQDPKKSLGVIDHILYNTASGATATDGAIIELDQPLSDHKPIWAELVFPRKLKMPGSE